MTDQLSEMPVEVLRLSPRLEYRLKAGHGVETVKDFMDLKPLDIQHTKGVGPIGFQEYLRTRRKITRRQEGREELVEVVNRLNALLAAHRQYTLVKDPKYGWVLAQMVR